LTFLLPSFPPVAQLNRHTLPDGLQSVNGSDPTGGCVDQQLEVSFV